MSVRNRDYSKFVFNLYKKRDKAAVSGIYKISCKVTNEFYIGSSTDINKRWTMHKYDLKHKRHVNYKLRDAYEKHGPRSFEYEIIYTCTVKIKRNDLYNIEQKYIDELKPTYNIQLTVQLYKPVAPIKGVKRLKEGVTGKSLKQEKRDQVNKERELKPKKVKQGRKIKLTRLDEKRVAKKKWSHKPHIVEMRKQNDYYAERRKQAEINKLKIQNDIS